MDTTSTSRHRPPKSKDLNILIREAGLFDIWGEEYIQGIKSLPTKVHSRLDFFLMNTIDRQQISDHNIVSKYI